MKKITAIILFVCYAMALIRPITPVIGDVIAHTFWRAQHMATVHFENGQYHVHYALATAAKEDYGNKKSSSVKVDETLDTHIIVNNGITLATDQTKLTFLPYTLGHCSSAFPVRDAPPPKA
ncbi:MAG TPA: hypothetical protein VNZ45_03095 [Bacteroidia bacterium]|jgi:hypothetical protein|nr:hypothetical protein [Bacteroidia bacterium]